MYHPNHNVSSPFTPPITSMGQLAFDFSPNAITRTQSSKNPGARTSTPNFLNNYSPNISAINCFNSTGKYGSLNSTNDADLDSTWKQLELMSLNDGYGNSFNTSNINNRRLNVNSILDDLKLGQYKAIFEVQEIDLIAFILLTDEDLQQLGVIDQVHRQMLTNAIKQFWATSAKFN